jgi:hypothetical protein
MTDERLSGAERASNEAIVINFNLNEVKDIKTARLLHRWFLLSPFKSDHRELRQRKKTKKVTNKLLR